MIVLRSLHAALVLSALVLLMLHSSTSNNIMITTTDNTASSSSPINAIRKTSHKTSHKTSSSLTTTNIEPNTKTVNHESYNPALLASVKPTAKPTSKPTFKPTTSSPSREPTSTPSTSAPTLAPTLNPTFNPTKPTSTSFTPVSGGKIAGIIIFTITFAGAIVLAYAHDYCTNKGVKSGEGGDEDSDEKKSEVDPFDLDDDLSVVGMEAAGGNVPSRDENQDISVDADDDEGVASESSTNRSGFAAIRNPLRR